MKKKKKQNKIKRNFVSICLIFAVLFTSIIRQIPFKKVNADAESYLNYQKEYIESRFDLSSYNLVDSDTLDLYGDSEDEIAYRVCSFTYLIDGDMWAFITIQNGDESELSIDTYLQFMFTNVTNQLGTNPIQIPYNYDFEFEHNLQFEWYEDSYEYNWIFYYNYSSNLNRLFLYHLNIYDDNYYFYGEYFRYLGNIGATINELSQDEYEAIYQKGFRNGFNAGESSQIDSNFMRNIFTNLDAFFSIHLAPHLTIGEIVLAPLIIWFVWFLIKQFKGGD